MRFPLYASNLIIAPFFLLGTVHAVLVNVSIDDEFGDPHTGRQISFTPTGAWNDGTNCSACTAHPDPTLSFDGTWHDSTFNTLPGSNNFPNTVLLASVGFNGTAVYVFCTLALTTASPDGDSDMTFYIDGSVVGTFLHPAPGTPGYQYNVSVYSNTSLSPGFHNIVLQNGHTNGTKSLMILDYITYTYDDGTPGSNTTTGNSINTSSNRATPGATIAGAVVGGIVGLCIIAGLAMFLVRRRKRRDVAVDDQLRPEAFTLDGVGDTGMVSRTSGPFTPSVHPTITNPSTSFNSTPTPATYAPFASGLHYDPYNTNDTVYNLDNQNPSSSSIMNPQYRLVPGALPLPSSTIMISPPPTGLSSSERGSMYVPSEAPPAYELARSEPSSSSSRSRSRGRSSGRRRDRDRKSPVVE